MSPALGSYLFRLRSVYIGSMGKPGAKDWPLVLGVNAAYHESAAAIIRGGEVVFAAEEERYSRERHAKAARVTNPDQLPWLAIHDCLQAAGCKSLGDLDAVAYSLTPGRRLAMVGGDPYPIGEAVGFGTFWGAVFFFFLAQRAFAAARAESLRSFAVMFAARPCPPDRATLCLYSFTGFGTHGGTVANKCVLGKKNLGVVL